MTYFSQPCIYATLVRFTGGGNRSKPPTSIVIHKTSCFHSLHINGQEFVVIATFRYYWEINRRILECDKIHKN
jgi:hypothetical protein